MKKLAEMTDAPLELLGLGEVKHPLGRLVSISIEYYLDSSRKLFWSFEIVGCNVFTNSLMGTTIQDGGKRERSDGMDCFLLPDCCKYTSIT